MLGFLQSGPQAYVEVTQFKNLSSQLFSKLWRPSTTFKSNVHRLNLTQPKDIELSALPIFALLSVKQIYFCRFESGESTAPETCVRKSVSIVV